MRKLLLALALIPFFCVPCHAEELYPEIAESFGVAAVSDAVSEETEEISGRLTIDGSYDADSAMKRLWNKLCEELKSSLRAELGTAAALIAISFFCAVCSSLCTDRGSAEFASVCGCCGAVYITLNSTQNVLDRSLSAIIQLSDYSKAALPVLFTASAAGGAAISASGRYAASSLALDVMMSAAQSVIIPLICAYLALSVSLSVFENAFIKAVSLFFRKLTVTLMTAMTIAFCGYIAVTGLVSGSADAVAVRTAKTVLSTSLPVVGGIISDAAGAVLSAAGVVKNSVGVFSLIVVCGLCISPFAVLSVKMTVYKLASSISETAPNRRLATLLDNIGTAMGMLTGMVGSFAVMLFISLVSGIRAVTG